jgi:hypothetical protein
MRIRQRILKVQAAVVADKADGDPKKLGKLVGDAAEAAIFAGINSEQWKDYMSLFATSEEQLTRLTTADLDGPGDSAVYMPRIRAYVAVNGVCAPGTDAATMKGHDGAVFSVSIDDDKPNGAGPLDVNPAAAVTQRRKAKFPDLPDFAEPQNPGE